MDVSRYLAIYVNDHLLGAAIGLELFHRAAGGLRDPVARAEVARLAQEVQEDCDALRAVAHRLGVRVRPGLPLLGKAAERLGRLKPNGHLLRRSPLSDVVELEALRLGVQGKEAGFRALREVADAWDALDPAELDRLVARARGQADVLERLRLAAAADALGAGRGR